MGQQFEKITLENDFRGLKLGSDYSFSYTPEGRLKAEIGNKRALNSVQLTRLNRIADNRNLIYTITSEIKQLEDETFESQLVMHFYPKH